MNREENDQKDIPSKFIDDLPIPNEINLSDIDKNDEYELFKCSKYNDASQPKINSILNLSKKIIIYLKASKMMEWK